MKIVGTKLPGVLVIEPVVFRDARGFFVETYHQARLAEQGLGVTFVQDNLSRSRRGVLRGLHYQVAQAQGKFVRATRGEIFDVAVDLRRGSPTFGQWYGITLNDDNLRALYVPPGFAHGFCVLSESADVYYQCTEFYAPQHERAIIWNDPQIAIAWPITMPELSAKDQQAARLCEAELPPV